MLWSARIVLVWGINMRPSAFVKMDTHPNKQTLLLAIYLLVGNFATPFSFLQVLSSWSRTHHIRTTWFAGNSLFYQVNLTFSFRVHRCGFVLPSNLFMSLCIFLYFGEHTEIAGHMLSAITIKNPMVSSDLVVHLHPQHNQAWCLATQTFWGTWALMKAWAVATNDLVPKFAQA